MTEHDYVLGTHDEEIARLGIQHGVWRQEVLACWRGAGIGPGSRVLDLGAGPGYATLDLAEAVGPGGEVVAVERSERFLQHAREACRRRGVGNVRFIEKDLAADDLDLTGFDASWCRWVAAFVADPGRLVHTISTALKPGGAAIFHEYADYASWKLAPRCPAVEEFVREVMAAWRESGGEPDIALELPRLLRDNGFRLRSARPIVWALRPSDPGWQWLGSFVESGLRRLVDLKRVKPAWAENVRAEFRKAQSDPDSRMLTPLVLELVAEKA